MVVADELLCLKNAGTQCFSHQMNDWHPWQLKKSKSWGPFWSWSIANSAHLAHFLGGLAELAVLFSY